MALIAYDIWTHFKAYARPDGFKAQIVAYDREAVILYKRALDRVIAQDLIAAGTSDADAWAEAARFSACVYSRSQEDDKPSEDPQTDAIRADLRAQFLDDEAEKATKKAFGRKGIAPDFLIVCDKLLTGFDAPLEAVMYLDKPLKEHNLLQAIARTNRVHDARKRSGLIVDYIGVSNQLDQALASYRADDVKNALRNLDDLRNQLRAAHAAVLQPMKGLKRRSGPPSETDLKAEFDQFVALLKTEDHWFDFKTRAQAFIGFYEQLSPDQAILAFTDDLKWIATFLRYGTQVFEKQQAFDYTEYSRKIREMLDEHLDATGLGITLKLRSITDPEFWEDFSTDGKSDADLQEAAIRKTTELRKTLTERLAQNPHQYGKFSERLRALLERLDRGQKSFADLLKVLKGAEALAKDLHAEAHAHEGSGLTQEAHGVLTILRAFGSEDSGLATAIADLYVQDDTAPPLWQEKDGLRKTLRQRVRALAHAAGLTALKEIPEQVEEFALQHLSKA